MDMLLANVNHLEFKMERDLIEQIGAIALPFNGMDKSTAAVCQFLNSKDGIECDKGSRCPFRHIRGDRTIVCKHWLRGLCKKGDQCEFLHEYDMKKMPECYFYSRFNACHNKECPFLHIDPESKIKDCPWYDRGFCRHGPHCRHRHVRRVMCMNYLAGFCMNGWECKHMHPRFELPALTDTSKDQTVKKIPTCHYCGELGHKASNCRKLQEHTEAGGSNLTNLTKPNGYHRQFSGNAQYQHHHQQQQHHHHHQHQSNDASANENDSGGDVGSVENEQSNNSNNSNVSNQNLKGSTYPRVSKPIEEITCFKCGNKGHYANKCPKGHLAFLSNQRSHK